MRRTGTRYLGILLLSLTCIFSDVVVAQIYKWVDADGKVHYGDKPRDQVQASEAQQVELRESYQPAVRTAQEQEAYDEEQRLIILRDQMRRRDEKEAQEEGEVKRREEKTALCADYEEAINELNTVVVKNGVRHLVVLTGEDGKAVSAERQRQILEELQEKMTDAGCT